MEMEKMTTIPQPKDVPVELIQCIQSLLPFKEDARTCILSKSWLHAWSTIPTLKFLRPDPRKYVNQIHRTLQRYHRDNIPIESFHLQLSIVNENQEELASLARTWIQQVVTKSCLKELSLYIEVFTSTRLTILTGELFSSQNLNAINLTKVHQNLRSYPLRICTNTVINCVSLRVLHLQGVMIIEDALQNLLSTCSLLEKIKLLSCVGFKNVNVKNLTRLQVFDISTEFPNYISLEINNVPSLRSFCYISLLRWRLYPIPFQMDSLTSVTQLHIDGVMINTQFFDIVKAKFPLLESLTLGFGNWGAEDMVITSVSLRWLTIKLAKSFSAGGPINLQVNAPRLFYFGYDGILIPDLTFPSIAPEQIKLTLHSTFPSYMDRSYFLKMRKALNLSSKFDITIVHDHRYELVPLDIDVDDLRRRASVSVMDVQLSLELANDPPKASRFFDAFFSICHPSYIKCEKNFSQHAFISIRKMMEGKMNNLKDVTVKNPHNEQWEALTSSWESVLETLTDHRYFECKLIWCPE